MLDMTATKLLKCITECSEQEAKRLVFMGWPGQSELEAATNGSSSNINSLNRRIDSEGDLLSFDIRNHQAVPMMGNMVEGRPTKAMDALLDEPHSRHLG